MLATEVKWPRWMHPKKPSCHPQPERGHFPRWARQAPKELFLLQLRETQSSHQKFNRLSHYLVSPESKEKKKKFMGNNKTLPLSGASQFTNTVFAPVTYCNESLKRKRDSCGQNVAPCFVITLKNNPESSCPS